MEEPTTVENLRVLYKENALVAHAFWEWRHKLITLYVLAVSAVFIVAGWMYNHDEMRRYVFVPFVLGCVLSSFLALMDSVNARLLKYCYQLNKGLEKQLNPLGLEMETESGEPIHGIYQQLAEGFKKHLNYSRILNCLYWSTAGFCLLAAGVAVVWFRS